MKRSLVSAGASERVGVARGLGSKEHETARRPFRALQAIRAERRAHHERERRLAA
jgi:hypothetical protein